VNHDQDPTGLAVTAQLDVEERGEAVAERSPSSPLELVTGTSLTAMRESPSMMPSMASRAASPVVALSRSGRRMSAISIVSAAAVARAPILACPTWTAGAAYASAACAAARGGGGERTTTGAKRGIPAATWKRTMNPSSARTAAR